MFYAIYHPYGVRAMSVGDTLYAYETKAQRDANGHEYSGRPTGRSYAYMS